MRLPVALSLLAVALGATALAVALTRDPGLTAGDLRVVSQYSAQDSIKAKEVVVMCPPGTRMISGGGSVGYPARMPTVATTRSVPFSDRGREGWWYAAREITPLATKWDVFAVAVCF